MDNAVYSKKFDNLNRVLSRQKADYVPTLAFPGPATATWKGMSAVEAMVDPDTYVKALNGVFSEMWVDATIDHGVTTSPIIEETLINVQYKFGPDGTTIEHIQKSPMKEDEYDQLIADPEAFIKSILIPRMFPQLFTGNKQDAADKLKKVIDAQGYVFGGLGFPLMESMKNKYNIVPICGMDFAEVPLDTIFDVFRGFQGTLTDLRRRPQQVKEACEVLWTVYDGVSIDEPVEDPSLFAEQMPHMPAYLSPKQYYEFYWPYEKKHIERYANAGGKILILLEGKWKHIWECFKDVPKDSMIFMCDDDDIFELSNELGEHQIVTGGAKLAKLRLDSKQANLDLTKKVIDKCAPNGGFIFGSDKNWISPGDVNQNLIDIYNFAHEYGRY